MIHDCSPPSLSLSHYLIDKPHSQLIMITQWRKVNHGPTPASFIPHGIFFTSNKFWVIIHRGKGHVMVGVQLINLVTKAGAWEGEEGDVSSLELLVSFKFQRFVPESWQWSTSKTQKKCFKFWTRQRLKAWFLQYDYWRKGVKQIWFFFTILSWTTKLIRMANQHWNKLSLKCYD